MMIQKRCPWCGELLKPKLLDKYIIINRWGAKCVNCEKYYTVKFVGVPLIIDIVLILLFFVLSNLRVFNYYRVYPLLFLFIIIPIINRILYIRTPFIKYNKNSWYEVKEKPYSLEVEINWDYKNKFQLASGCILPACFYNQQGLAVSQTLCVVLNRLKHRKHITFAEMEFVMDDIPKELFAEGNTFYLFNDKERIADCKITKVHYTY